MTSVFRGQRSQSADSSRRFIVNSRDDGSSGVTPAPVQEQRKRRRESFDVPLLKDTDAAPCEM